MARYGKAFKDRAVARLLPPESTSVEEVSRQIGVSVSTLERWHSEALASGEAGGVWTAPARFHRVDALAHALLLALHDNADDMTGQRLIERLISGQPNADMLRDQAIVHLRALRERDAILGTRNEH